MHPILATHLTAAVLADRERSARQAALIAGAMADRPSRVSSIADRMRAARHALAASLDIRLAGAPCPEALAMPHVPDPDRG